MKLDADPTVIYPVTKGKPLGPADPPLRAQRRQRLQHLSPRRPARRADRQPRQGEHRGGASPGADQGALFRRRRHRRACLRGHACRAQCERRQMVSRSAASGGRCEEPRDRPRPDVHGRPAAVRGGDRLGRSALMMSPHGEAVGRGHRACPHRGRHVRAQQRDRDAGAVRACRPGCCSRRAGRTRRGATMRSWRCSRCSSDAASTSSSGSDRVPQLAAERLASDIADAAGPRRHSPTPSPRCRRASGTARPAPARGPRSASFRRRIAQQRRGDDRALDRLGIMRGDHPARQRDVGKVLAIGVEMRGPAGRDGPVSAKPSALVSVGGGLADDRPVGRGAAVAARGGCA